MKANTNNHTAIAGTGTNSSVIILFLLINFIAKAEIFTTKQNGSFDQNEIWTPAYPGNVIKETDTIVINNDVVQNIDLVVKGTVIIKESGSLKGTSDLIIVKSGTLLNLGTSKFGILTNRGAIYNQQSLEVSLDFVNSGNVINHKSVTVGNLLDNTGIITGKNGEVFANRKFINSRTGRIKGNLDLCSSNFLNVEGGTIDTETTTFCGNPIFNSNGMMAMQNEPLHFEKSVAAVSIKTGEYAPF